MITAGIFNTIEFYVTAATLAAMVVGLSAMPRRRGPVREFAVEGELTAEAADGGQEPAVVMASLDDGSVSLTRLGLEDVTVTGIFRLDVAISGTDVTITERVARGSDWNEAARAASCVLDMLGQDRYHIRYVSEATGQMAVFTFNNRRGMRTTRRLSD